MNRLGAVGAATIVWATFGLPSSALAQTTPEACAALEDGAHRLICYDALFRVDQQVKAAPTNWTVREDTSRIDDSKSIFLSTPALASYGDDYGTARLPALLVRCMENTTALMVDFDGDFMSDSSMYGPVVMRIDEQPAADYDMQASTDHNALGLWRGGNSIPAIKKLLGAKRLIVRATPVNSSPVTVEFNVAGLDQVIAPLREACAW